MPRKLNKLLILLTFIVALGASGEALAQCYGCGNYGGFYNPYMGIFPSYATSTQKATWGIYNFFDAVNQGLDMMEQSAAMERNIMVRRSNLENYNSVKRYYTEGIPPFAAIAPDGKPRSPKITWQVVQSIR